MGPAQKHPSLPFTSHTAALPPAALEARNPQNLQAVLPQKQWCQPLGCLRAVLSDQAFQAPAMRQRQAPPAIAISYSPSYLHPLPTLCLPPPWWDLSLSKALGRPEDLTFSKKSAPQS